MRAAPAVSKLKLQKMSSIPMQVVRTRMMNMRNSDLMRRMIERAGSQPRGADSIVGISFRFSFFWFVVPFFLSIFTSTAPDIFLLLVIRLYTISFSPIDSCTVQSTFEITIFPISPHDESALKKIPDLLGKSPVVKVRKITWHPGKASRKPRGKVSMLFYKKKLDVRRGKTYS